MRAKSEAATMHHLEGVLHVAADIYGDVCGLFQSCNSSMENRDSSLWMLWHQVVVPGSTSLRWIPGHFSCYRVGPSSKPCICYHRHSVNMQINIWLCRGTVLPPYSLPHLWWQHCCEEMGFLKCWLILPRAQHLWWTQENVSENFQKYFLCLHRRTQCCCHSSTKQLTQEAPFPQAVLIYSRMQRYLCFK